MASSTFPVRNDSSHFDATGHRLKARRIMAAPDPSAADLQAPGEFASRWRARAVSISPSASRSWRVAP
jgi:hypothetical protein